MASWLTRKGQDSRVYMCLKELRWDVEQSSEIRRAQILAISAFVRVNILAEYPDDLSGILDRPLDFSRDRLMELYELLEDFRNANTVQLNQTQKNMRRFGMNLPQFAADHAAISGRALEVWMATIGAGVLPKRRDEAREVWKLLGAARPFLDDAIEAIRSTEKQTAELTGEPSAGFSNLYTTAEWEELCAFVPSQLSE